MKLFIVVLGGKCKSSHIEQHDVRWVVGNNIESTFNQLRNQWIGSKVYLHIDSYMHVKYIDGFEVIPRIHKNIEESSYYRSYPYKGMSLWFINLGGYDPNSLNECHKYDIIASSNVNEAREVALKKWNTCLKSIHIDNSSLIISSDKYSGSRAKNYSIDWHLELKKDPSNRSQMIKPDWYGYLRIDSFTQSELPIDHC